MMRATSAACMAWPARSAITCPSSGLPISAKVADQIERLVAAALVGETQSARIQHACAIEADRVVERRAANQSHVAHLVQFVLESERARRRDLGGIALGRHLHFQRLPPDQRVIEEDIAGEPESCRRGES